MTSRIVAVDVRDILPNPYRNLDKYVLDATKIDALKQSYETSGFWDGSIQARPSPTIPDKYEIAFGHHRIEAARIKGITPVGLVVSQRSNADMLRMMAHENSTDFRNDMRPTIETIRAVIEAYGRGEIELEVITGHGANQQQYSLPSGKHYSLATVARFLNWVKNSDNQATTACRVAFDAYREEAASAEAIEQLGGKEATETAILAINTAIRAARVSAHEKGLTPSQTRQAEKAAAEATANAIHNYGAARGRGEAVSAGKAAVDAIVGKKKPKTVPVEFYIATVNSKSLAYNAYGEFLKQCDVLLPVLEHVRPEAKEALAAALERMLERTTQPVSALIRALRAEDVEQLTRLLSKETSS